jgi:hypothetical protein
MGLLVRLVHQGSRVPQEHASIAQHHDWLLDIEKKIRKRIIFLPTKMVAFICNKQIENRQLKW